MKNILFVFCLLCLVNCSTPKPLPQKIVVVYPRAPYKYIGAIIPKCDCDRINIVVENAAGENIIFTVIGKPLIQFNDLEGLKYFYITKDSVFYLPRDSSAKYTITKSRL